MQAKEHTRRRKRLMQMMGKGAVAIVPAAPERTRNRDVHYAYRQDSDFLYLTGFPEPEAVAVLAPGRPHGEYLLFCRERNPERETWDGRRAGPEGAVAQYGADDAFPIEDIEDILPGILEQSRRVYYTMGVYHDFDQHVIGWIHQLRSQGRSGVHAPDTLVALDHLLHDMRLYKSAAEAKTLREVGRIAARGHRRAMQTCRPGMTEYQVEAELLHEFMHAGCRSTAYPSIVGGGANGCILHYVENSAPLNDGDLLLIDAGAELDGYASDITRTFPVNGRYSKAQRAVYEVVLAAQRAAIDKVRVGNHWNDPHEAAVRALTEGMVELGILKGKVEDLIESHAYRRYYMHRTGHWLGLDVHDVGDYKVDGEWRVLEAGMVMTVEPGLYLPAGSKGLAKRWWNIGIRIEDDVLVTAKGPEVLTDEVPKDPDEVEALMARA